MVPVRRMIADRPENSGRAGPAQRRRAAWVTALMAVLAVIEVTGIVSIAPFLAVLGNPDAVRTNRHLSAGLYLSRLSRCAAFSIRLMGIISFAVLVATSAFRALAQFVKSRFAAGAGMRSAFRLLQTISTSPMRFS